jgi:hypothetical protein
MKLKKKKNDNIVNDKRSRIHLLNVENL